MELLAEVLEGDCLEGMRQLDDGMVDAVVTDPPYELGFMGATWDSSGIAYSVAVWREALRVLKPGGHLLAFSGSRTSHRMVCAIEDAGFVIRDSLQWLYGSGFPKSLDVSKAIDKRAGAVREVIGVRPGHEGFENRTDRHSAGTRTEGWDRPWKADPEAVRLHHMATAPATDAARQWSGWGTALKPAHEPICLARKPLIGTVAANVLEHGTGALNVDGCRIIHGPEVHMAEKQRQRTRPAIDFGASGLIGTEINKYKSGGRWPANVILDEQAGEVLGEPARFFYCPKVSKKERAGNAHKTVKPIALMRWLCRLITPPGGLVLDPFAGSGTTGVACVAEGFDFVGFDIVPEHVEIANERLSNALRNL